MPRFKQRWIRGLAAAALVLVVAGEAYHYTAVSVSAYVSVDAGGSSIEFTVNRLGRVTSVVSVSDNDSELAEALSSRVNGMSVEDAVTSALDTLTEKGGFSPQDDLVIVGITSGSDSQAESLENAIMNNTGHSVYTVRVSDEERKEAHRQELGGGLYVYGTEDATEAVINEQLEDNVPVTTEAEINVISVFENELPISGTQETTATEMPPVNENDNIIQHADIPQEQPTVTASPESPGIPETLRQSEPPFGEAPQDRPEMQNETAPAVSSEKPQQKNEQCSFRQQQHEPYSFRQ